MRLLDNGINLPVLLKYLIKIITFEKNIFAALWQVVSQFYYWKKEKKKEKEERKRNMTKIDPCRISF